MSPEAAERLRRWLEYLGPKDFESDEALRAAMTQWEKGEEPPVQVPWTCKNGHSLNNSARRPDCYLCGTMTPATPQPETMGAKIDRIASALMERLSEEEYAVLRDIFGDYSTDEFLCKKLTELAERTPATTDSRAHGPKKLRSTRMDYFEMKTVRVEVPQPIAELVDFAKTLAGNDPGTLSDEALIALARDFWGTRHGEE